jgi:hypothetical protein
MGASGSRVLDERIEDVLDSRVFAKPRLTSASRMADALRVISQNHCVAVFEESRIVGALDGSFLVAFIVLVLSEALEKQAKFVEEREPVSSVLEGVELGLHPHIQRQEHYVLKPAARVLDVLKRASKEFQDATVEAVMKQLADVSSHTGGPGQGIDAHLSLRQLFETWSLGFCNVCVFKRLDESDDLCWGVVDELDALRIAERVVEEPLLKEGIMHVVSPHKHVIELDTCTLVALQMMKDFGLLTVPIVDKESMTLVGEFATTCLESLSVDTLPRVFGENLPLFANPFL